MAQFYAVPVATAILRFMSAACPELGFRLVVTFAASTAQSSIEACRSVFQYDVIDRNNLIAIGGGPREWRYTITKEGGQATDADRELVRDWIAQHFGDASISVGPIVDLSGG